LTKRKKLFSNFFLAKKFEIDYLFFSSLACFFSSGSHQPHGQRMPDRLFAEAGKRFHRWRSLSFNLYMA